MLSLCLGLTGTVWVQLPVADFTLAWNHSVEKIRWEEDYRVTGQGLVLEQARVRGSGAGMEVPDGAQMKDGSWQYRRELPPLTVAEPGPDAGGRRLRAVFRGSLSLHERMGRTAGLEQGSDRALGLSPDMKIKL
jgi:hypothetical protein